MKSDSTIIISKKQLFPRKRIQAVKYKLLFKKRQEQPETVATVCGSPRGLSLPTAPGAEGYIPTSSLFIKALALTSVDFCRREDYGFFPREGSR